MNTFTITFLRDALIKRNAFIYHGAAIAKGVGNSATNNILYLDRLKRVITDDLEVCCSTVRFGDSELNCNFWGRMGLILWPKSPNSITLVSPQDAGTIPDHKTGRRKLTRLPITTNALVNSIDKRPPREANEWCILDYDVIGIFVEPEIQYVENETYHTITLKEVFDNFPDMKVFAFHNNQLREVIQYNQCGSLISIADLYPI